MIGQLDIYGKDKVEVAIERLQMFGPAEGGVSMPECPLCKKRGKTWEGDDPVCALKNGKFSDDNWNCATMNKLREIAIRLGLTYPKSPRRTKNSTLGWMSY